MNYKRIFLVLALLALALNLFMPQKAMALECGVIPQQVCDNIINTKTAVDSPTAAVMPLIDFIANILVGIFGAVIVLVVIVSGVQISASGGNEEIIKKGKENIFKAVTGLVLLISFRAILLLINRLFEGVDTNVLFVGDNLAPGGIPRLLGNAISMASFFAGIVSVVFVIVGGIQYITSGGGDQIKKAKRTITFALIGLVISVSSYAILLFIQGQLQK
jgi:hypothetical protein